jgi:asparagine synthase (glutamine-hydrolysing)
MKVDLLHCISAEFGWKKFSSSEVDLWFKGYLLSNNTHESLLKELISFYYSPFVNIKIMSNWVKSISGHFGIIISTDKWSFASVDKISSIPIFYAEVKDKIIISNKSQLIKDKVGLKIKNKSALEIAMSGYTIGRNTLYCDLYQLTAGECLFTSSSCGIQRQFYYTYSPWKVHNRSRSILKNQLTESILEGLESLASTSDGRQIVIPLSAGSDSRLIASGLKYIGIKNVFCFSYGRPGNYEMTASKEVSKKLGFSWTEVVLTSKIQRNFFLSKEFENFKKSFDTLSSIPHIQEVNAIGILKNSGKISSDAIFVNGNTGDFISGGHIPTSLYEKKIQPPPAATLHDDNWDNFLDKHFSLWKILRTNENNHYVKRKIQSLVGQRNAPNFLDIETRHGLYECAEYLGRQSKFIIGMQRAYEFHDYSWQMPLWSDPVMSFWEGVPYKFKIKKNLYNETLLDNNWGGVWKKLPINHRPIQPIWLQPIRFISKSCLSLSDREVWYQFEKNAFQYFLDATRNSVITPYAKVLLDRRGQRHWVSWVSEIYLQQHGFRKLDKAFPD